MIIFLYGNDSYGRGEKLRALTAAYKEKHQETDFLSLDFEEEPDRWQEARDFLGQPSMFVDSKILVLKNGGLLAEKEWQKILKAELETPKTFVLIFQEKPPLKNLNFLLKKPVKTQEFNEPEGENLRRFVLQEMEKRKIIFAPQSFRAFCDQAAGRPERSWFVVNELDKIALAGFPAPVSLTDLRLALRPPPSEFSYAKTGNIFRSRKAGERLFWLEDLFFTKEDPAYLFNALAYEASGRDALRLAYYDVLIKSGRLDYEEALLDFALGS